MGRPQAANPGERSGALGNLGLALGGALLASACEGSQAPDPTAGILLVSWDTTAASHLSVYGYERETTPNLERFAEQAVLFERCLTNAPWTLPSYASLLSGLDPATLRLAEQEDGPRADGDRAYAIQPTVETLPEVLSAAGWRTAAFVDVPWIGVNYGLDQGFEILDHTATNIALEDRSGGLATTVDLGLQWMDSLDDGELGFLLLHGFDAHGPYFAPEELVQRFRGDALFARTSAQVETNALLGSYGGIQEYLNECLVDENGVLPDTVDRAELLAMYDAGLLEMDQHFGTLIAGLEERDALDHWTVLLHADHGESTIPEAIDGFSTPAKEAGYAFYFAHGQHDWEALFVPLLIRPRGGTQARSIQVGVESLDLYPTILDLAGVEPPSEVRRPGRSLTGALHGEELEMKATWASGGLMEQDSIHWPGLIYLDQRPVTASLATRLTFPSPRTDGWRREHFGSSSVGALQAEDLAELSKRPDRDELQAELDALLTEIGEQPTPLAPPGVVYELNYEFFMEMGDWLAERKALALEARQVLGEPKVVGKLDDAQLQMLKAAGYVDE